MSISKTEVELIRQYDHKTAGEFGGIKARLDMLGDEIKEMKDMFQKLQESLSRFDKMYAEKAELEVVKKDVEDFKLWKVAFTASLKAWTIIGAAVWSAVFYAITKILDGLF